MRRGRFISFEGGEGAGKSTQLRLLGDALRAARIDVLLTREPGGAPGAEAIRKLLVEGEPGRLDAEAEALLMNAARRIHLVQTITPALEAGRWVLCDRFADSTIAYQGYGGGVDLAVLRSLQRIAAGDVAPDLTLILDIPVAAGLKRAARRKGKETRFERMGEDFHERLRQGFLAIAKAEPKRCTVIDASGKLEAVQAAIRSAVSERLGIAL